MADDFKTWEEKFSVNDEDVSVYSCEIDEIDEANDNIDIFVDYKGETFSGIVTTPMWIANYLATNNMGDVCWHCDHDLILPDLSKAKIVEAISSLIKSGNEIEFDYLRDIFILSDSYD